MKGLTFVACILLSFNSSAQVGTINHLDETNGFGGVILGDTVTNLKYKTIPKLGYSDPDKDGVVNYFVTDEDILKLNDRIAFEDMMVHYLDGKAYSIDLNFNYTELTDLIDALKIAYGKPTSEDNISNLYKVVWKGKNTFLILLAYTSGGKNTLSFNSIKGYQAFQNKRNESIKKAASKL